MFCASHWCLSWCVVFVISWNVDIVLIHWFLHGIYCCIICQVVWSLLPIVYDNLFICIFLICHFLQEILHVAYFKKFCNIPQIFNDFLSWNSWFAESFRFWGNFVQCTLFCASLCVFHFIFALCTFSFGQIFIPSLFDFSNIAFPWRFYWIFEDVVPFFLKLPKLDSPPVWLGISWILYSIGSSGHLSGILLKCL